MTDHDEFIQALRSAERDPDAYGDVEELLGFAAERLERLAAQRDAIALMWFRELENTLAGEARLYHVVGPDIYTGVDDATAIGAAIRVAALPVTERFKVQEDEDEDDDDADEH